MKVNFRQEARKALKRAKFELDTLQQDRLKYAALELRMAMEALTYDRAHAYRKEIPPNEYETWQPRKVMQLLLDIDPNADKGSTISIGVEAKYGEPATSLTTLGTEEVLNLRTIKKYYDALGSYLHITTLKQMNKSSHVDYEKLRDKCNEILKEIEKALDSPVYNMTIGSFLSINCIRCNEHIRRRLPPGCKTTDAKCFTCGAEYIVRELSDNKSEWTPLQQEIDCPTEGCKTKFALWKNEVKIGTTLICDGCGENFRINLAMFKHERDS